MPNLSAAQRETFDRTGLLTLSGFFPAADTAAMASALWADLAARFAIRRHDPATWTKVRPAQFQAVEKAGAFAALGSPALVALANDLLGLGAWAPPRRWGQPLVTFPSAAWDLARVMWHLDYPVMPGRLHAIKLFALLEPLAPHGGGTLVVEGSHTLALRHARADGRPIPSAQIRRRLEAAHPWFADLWRIPGDDIRALLGAETLVDGVPVRVVEMTGDPGDLVLMHPAALHGLSHNALPRPRMMLAQGLHRTP